MQQVDLDLYSSVWPTTVLYSPFATVLTLFPPNSGFTRTSGPIARTGYIEVTHLRDSGEAVIIDIVQYLYYGWTAPAVTPAVTPAAIPTATHGGSSGDVPVPSGHQVSEGEAGYWQLSVRAGRASQDSGGRRLGPRVDE
ncbi:hypothetical protein ElyMa_006694000 [Elysia marginata]|uniref:Uncharacterized protein n=1 Tax=Elysia marginata TaxID=1093978 RepID=A0AAV4IQT4_9GAST|nr:hypothetical protein ElyMa_006694000 [Elysia marginata]